MNRLAPLVALGLALGAAPASAQDTRVVVHQQLVALLNPMGAEHTLEVGARAPIGDPEELLFSGTHVEGGAIAYTSPVYNIAGGYLRVSPLAFLVLRAELTGSALWPIGMDGAGYYGLDGYDAEVRDQALAADLGGNATGWNLRLLARLQGAVPLWEGARLIVANQQAWEHDTLGDQSHYYSMKHDLVLARQDWLVQNDALALLNVAVASDVGFTVGAYSNLRWVPSSSYVGHQVGPMVAVSFERVTREVGTIDLFVRGGYYTHHVTRGDELTILGGISIDYDLGGVR